MKKVATRAAAAVMAVAVALAPMAAWAQRGNPNNNPLRNIPVTGYMDDGTQFAGTLDIERFEAVGEPGSEVLIAVGQLSGKLGNRPVNHQAVALPVQASTLASNGMPNMKTRPAVHDGSALVVVPAQVTCPVLHLTLGPLDLNLLGLVVHLNQVVLNIDAQAGGGLLGDLLCGIANLLNIGGAITQIVNLLNQITAILNGLGL